MLWYRVIVPHVQPEQPLPVLYLLHGANSDPRDVTEHSDVVKLSVESQLITVLPEGGYSYYTDAKHKRHSRWEYAITEEIPRDLAARFQVLTGREHTGIAGISMGGYGAVKLALKRPDLYGFVGDLSGSLDITRREASLGRWGQTWRIWTIFGFRRDSRRGEDVFHLLDRAKERRDMLWFESCGKNDVLFDVNQRFAQQLRKRGADLKSVTTPGGHDWQDWNAALPELFKLASTTLR